MTDERERIIHLTREAQAKARAASVERTIARQQLLDIQARVGVVTGYEQGQPKIRISGRSVIRGSAVTTGALQVGDSVIVDQLSGSITPLIDQTPHVKPRRTEEEPTNERTVTLYHACRIASNINGSSFFRNIDVPLSRLDRGWIESTYEAGYTEPSSGAVFSKLWLSNDIYGIGLYGQSLLIPGSYPLGVPGISNDIGLTISRDGGRNFTRLEQTLFGAQQDAIAFDDQNFVVAGQNGILRGDGTTFSIKYSTPNLNTGTAISGLARNGDELIAAGGFDLRFAAIAARNVIIRSTDQGVSWTEVFSETYSLEPEAVDDRIPAPSKGVWTGREWVLASNGNIIYRSEDGLSWAKITAIANANYDIIRIAGGEQGVIIFAVAPDPLEPKFLFSLDGLEWTEMSCEEDGLTGSNPFPTTGTTECSGLTYSAKAKAWIAMAAPAVEEVDNKDAYITYSTNGLIWKPAKVIKQPEEPTLANPFLQFRAGGVLVAKE